MSPIYDFRGMFGFELRVLAVTSRFANNLATYPSKFSTHLSGPRINSVAATDPNKVRV